MPDNTIPPERWVYTLPMRLRALFRRRQLDNDLDEELQLHLETREQELIESGMSAEEAHYAALREFGNVELARQNCRDTRKVLWLQNLAEDIRFSLRILRKNRTFTAVAILTIALAIGVNTAIFSVVNAMLLRPLPFAEPGRLVLLAESTRDMPLMFVSLANFADWQSRNTVFSSMGAFRRTSTVLTGRGDARRFVIGQVTSGMFATLGVQPLLGRFFTAAEDTPDGRPVVLLSDRFWAEEFANDPQVVGKQLTLNGQSYTIIGVVSTRGFPAWWRQMFLFTPLGRLNNEIGGEAHRDLHMGVSVDARLKPGVTLDQARANMLAIARQLEREHPQTNAGQSVAVKPLWQDVVGQITRPLQLLMGTVLLVLFIACANVASLLTSRAMVRGRELAIRGALGAGPRRLAAQLLCETTFLALVGGGLGLLIAFGLTPLLAHYIAPMMPRAEVVRIDRSVLLFTLVTSLLTAMIFGVVPALAAYRNNPSDAFKDCGRWSVPGVPRRGMRSLLAVAELAMAIVLLTAAGLTSKSLFKMVGSDLGMNSGGVLTGMLNFPPNRYSSDAQTLAFVERLQRRVSNLQGVTAAGMQSPQLPGDAQASFRAEGYPPPAHGDDPYGEISRITPGALEALGVRLLRGRFFTWNDNATIAPVCIIDDTMATTYWPGEDPIGKRIGLAVPQTASGQLTWRTVVGMVHRLQPDASSPPQLPQVYVPFAQFGDTRGLLIVRGKGDPMQLAPAVSNVVRSLDPDLPLYDVRPLADRLDENIAPERLLAVLLSAFGGIALLLAMLGVYGVTAYMITGRTREIGLRLALGARPRDIVRLVARHAVPLVGAGALIGVAAALPLSHLVAPVLVDVSPTDAGIIAGVAVLLIAAALGACCLPVRSAIAVDPIKVLYRE